MFAYITEHLGVFLTTFGAVFATVMAGIGSSKGCGLVGCAAAGVIAEEPEKFGKALVLQLLPGTQGLYGFIIGFLITLQLNNPLSPRQGLYYMLAAVPVGVMGWVSGVWQARVAASGLQIVAKSPDDSAKGVIFAAIVETYAILSFVASILFIFAVTLPN